MLNRIGLITENYPTRWATRVAALLIKTFTLYTKPGFPCSTLGTAIYILNPIHVLHLHMIFSSLGIGVG